jgi:hypothetical protein
MCYPTPRRNRFDFWSSVPVDLSGKNRVQPAWSSPVRLEQARAPFDIEPSEKLASIAHRRREKSKSMMSLQSPPVKEGENRF